jgi:hypothetical protein
MYQIETNSVPTARLSEGGMYRWPQGGMRAAHYRCLVKRRLRRECAATGAHAWVVLSPAGEVIETGAFPLVR